MSRGRRRSRRSQAEVFSGQEELPVELDLLRAELYRILDELARPDRADRRRPLLEFEQAWAQLKAALGLDGPGP
jgi:hypothetical protein